MLPHALGFTCWFISLATRNSSACLPWSFQPVCKPPWAPSDFGSVAVQWPCFRGAGCIHHCSARVSQPQASVGLPVQCSNLPSLALQTDTCKARPFLELTSHSPSQLTLASALASALAPLRDRVRLGISRRKKPRGL